MPTQISGSAGVSKVQDGVVETADIADLAVTQVKLAAAVVPLGVGQTWQDVTASRALGTDYTNTTGRPIEVFVTGNGTAAAGNSGIVVIGGVSMGIFGNYGSSSKSSITFTVPAGVVYRVNAGSNFALYQWAELR